MYSILRIFLMAVAAVFVLRWLRRQLSAASEGRPRPRGGMPWSGPATSQSAQRSKLKVLNFRSDPLEILGLEPGATDQEIAQEYDMAKAENDPEKVADMGEEIRTLAARRLADIERAYRQLTGEE